MWWYYGLLFLVGGVLGSFLNVVIMRTVEGEDWVRGRSRCDSCRHELTWYDNIPFFSFVWLRGRCRYCGNVIPIQHLVVELLTGILLVWWGVVGLSIFKLVEMPMAKLQPWFWLANGILLLGSLVVDMFYGVIPDLFLWGGIGVSLVYRLGLGLNGGMQWGDFWGYVLSAVGGVGFFMFLRWITRGRGMGEGDIYLAFWLGLLLGGRRFLLAMFLAFNCGALVGLGLMGLRRKGMKDTLPFAPYMIGGSFVALWWGEKLLKIIGF